MPVAQLKLERWWKATSAGSWIPVASWPFDSSLNWGEKMAWCLRFGDERGWEGPYDTKDDALEEASDFHDVELEDIQVSTPPAAACWDTITATGGDT